MDASRFTSRRAVRFELALAAAMALGASGASSALAADHFCTTTAQFQTALTNASLTTNDTITLQASASFVAPSGGFVLPNKTGTGWITIRSQNLASLPADGTRVDMGDAANMPNILPNNFSESAIVAATSAHHFKLVGLEVIGVQNGTTLSTGDLIRLGVSGTAQDTLTEQPGNFEIDRCIVRAASDTHRIKRGVALNSSSTNITDSYFSGFKDPSSDTQAICGWNGSGPYNITNNYLEAACENIMFGGAVPSIPNLVPSNIVITKNHFFKPISWNQHQPGTYGGNNWSIKNLFEIKNGANITLEGNIFENHWVDSQSGWSIVLTPATSPGVAPWTVVENVTFRNNIIRNISAGPNILARDADGDVSEQTNNILFENNLSGKRMST